MTRIEESRNSQSRENETREETEYVFEEPNATHIPRGVEEDLINRICLLVG